MQGRRYLMVAALQSLIDGRFDDARAHADAMLEVAALDESFRLIYLALLCHLQVGY